MENFDLHTGSKISKHTILESKIQKEINFKDFTEKNELKNT